MVFKQNGPGGCCCGNGPDDPPDGLNCSMRGGCQELPATAIVTLTDAVLSFGGPVVPSSIDYSGTYELPFVSPLPLFGETEKLELDNLGIFAFGPGGPSNKTYHYHGVSAGYQCESGVWFLNIWLDDYRAPLDYPGPTWPPPVPYPLLREKLYRWWWPTGIFLGCGGNTYDPLEPGQSQWGPFWKIVGSSGTFEFTGA